MSFSVLKYWKIALAALVVTLLCWEVVRFFQPGYTYSEWGTEQVTITAVEFTAAKKKPRLGVTPSRASAGSPVVGTGGAGVGVGNGLMVGSRPSSGRGWWIVEFNCQHGSGGFQVSTGGELNPTVGQTIIVPVRWGQLATRDGMTRVVVEHDFGRASAQ